MFFSRAGSRVFVVLLYGHLNKRLADSLVTKNKFLLTISIIFKEKRHEKKEKCQLGGTCLMKHQNLRIKVMINVGQGVRRIDILCVKIFTCRIFSCIFTTQKEIA